MFTIASLGSCRIATPLRLGRDEFGYEVNGSRTYGFCHSSAEAVQLMRFMQGHITPPAEIWPLLTRSADRAEMLKRPPQTADFYIVELSSAKRLTIGDFSIQLNYLAHQFQAFFADKSRARRFWDVCATKDQAAIDSLLRACWSATDEQRQNCDSLRQIRVDICAEDDLRADVQALMQGLGNVLFVTHVNAVKPDGLPIASRARFIDLVHKVVVQEGGLVYDPTPRMIEFGQEVAIEDHSDSLAHFTEEFSRQVVADFARIAFLPALDRAVVAGGAAAVAAMLAPHVEAMLAGGRAAELPGRLNVLAAQLPDQADIALMQARVALACGQSERGADLLQDAALRFPSHDGIRRLLPDAAFAVGLYDEAIAGFRRLVILGQAPSATEFQGMAEALQTLDLPEQALSFYEMAFWGGADHGAVAEHLVALSLTLRPAVLHNLGKAELARLRGLLNPLSRMRLALALNDIADLVPLQTQIGSQSAQAMLDIAQFLTAENRVDLAAPLLAAWREAQNGTRIVQPGLCAVLDGWFAQYETTTDLQRRIALLNAVVLAQPTHGPARSAMRVVRRDVVALIRDTARTGDLAGLERIAAAVQSLPEPVPELELYRARMLYAETRFAEALAIGRVLVQHMPENIALWALLMRCGLKLNDFLLMDRAALRVLALSDADTERLELEANSRLVKNPLICLRAADETSDPFLQYQYLAIACRDPKIATTSKNRMARVAAHLIAEMRRLEAEASTEFLPFAARMQEIFPDHVRVLQALGRHHVRNRSYDTALPYWQRLVALEPANKDHAFQFQRCQDRSSIQLSGPVSGQVSGISTDEE